ncbi:MAG: TonB-dependent receptor, partial [Acidobacteriales bacterium]|nr:TonB-dependent receptor [Terriglobales bacterium]
YYHFSQGLGPVNYPGYYSNYVQAFGPRAFSFNTYDYAGFATDDWKLTPRFTVTLGARYEYEQLPNAILANPQIPQTAHLADDKNNIGPRVGFAYDVFGTGKTVVRGGYGLYYGRIINSTIFNALTSTGNLAGQVSYNFSHPVSTIQFPNILSAAPTQTIKPSANYFDPHFQNPQIHETDFIVEQDLGWNTVLSLSYLGSYGRELPNFVDANFDRSQVSTVTYNVVGGGPLAALGPQYTTLLFTNKTRPNPGFTSITDIVSNVNSSYNALAFQANHNFSKGLQFNFNYTWSHALDTNQNQQTGTATNNQTNPLNLRADYGNSNYDVPNRVVVNAVYQPQWKANGWLGYLVNDFTIAPIWQWQNGNPYTLSVSGNAPGGAIGGINGSGGPNRIIELGRNTFRQPNTSDVDLRISKRFALTERYRLELLGEAFNLLNHQNITGVNSLGYIISGNTLTYQPAFGSFTNANSNTIFRERQLQLAVRFEF